MTEYIEREAAKRIVDDIDTWTSGWRDYAKLQMDSLSAADVVPVRHGLWIWTETGEDVYEQYWVCSACGGRCYWQSKYCSECGALMKDGDA